MARRRIRSPLPLGLVTILVGAFWGLAPAPVRAAAPAGPQRFVISPADSQVAYRVNETLIFEGNRFNIAVGTTKAIQGEIIVDRANPRSSRIGTITVDISTFRSDSERRDNAIRDRWLESRRFPLVTFTPTAIEGLPEVYRDGQDITLQVSGNLKIRDTTRPAVFATTIRLDGAVLTGTATTMFRMTDFGFDPPSILGIVRAENEVRLEFRFTARASP